MRTLDEVVQAFTPVGKLSVEQNMKLLKIEKTFIEAARDVCDLVPESADRTAALRKLLESKMTCVQAISYDRSQTLQASAGPTTASDQTPKEKKNANPKK